MRALSGPGPPPALAALKGKPPPHPQEGNSAACQHRKRWRGQQSRAAHTPRPGLPRGSCLEPATAPGTRPHRGSAAPHSLKGIYPPAGCGGQRARVDLRSRPGRAVRLAHIAAAPPQAPQCGHQRAQRGPSTEHGGERRGAARPPPMHEGPQRRAQRRSRGRRRRRAAARIVHSAARAPEPGPGLGTADAEGTIARPPPPLPLPPPRRRCRWRAAPSPLAPSVKSSVLCLAAAIVRRGPVPCLGRRPRETEGPRGVSGCGPAGSALRRGRPGVGGGRGGRERPGAQGRGRPASWRRKRSRDASSPELGELGVRPR